MMSQNSKPLITIVGALSRQGLAALRRAERRTHRYSSLHLLRAQPFADRLGQPWLQFKASRNFRKPLRRATSSSTFVQHVHEVAIDRSSLFLV